MNLLFTFCFFLFLASCSTTHIKHRDDALPLNGKTRIVTNSGNNYILHETHAEKEIITGFDANTQNRISIEKNDIYQIKQKSHAKGGKTGSRYGAGIGGGFGLIIGLGSPYTATIALAGTVAGGIYGGLGGLIAGHTDIYHFTDARLPDTQNKPDLQKQQYAIPFQQRDTWYAGFEVNNNVGVLPDANRSLKLSGLSNFQASGFAMEGGYTINPNLLAGLRWHNFSKITYDDVNGFDENIDFNSLLLTTTYFPKAKGHYARAGMGVTFYDNYRYEYNFAPYYVASDFNEVREDGLTSLIGLGYAFWIGDQLNVNLSADYNGYYFEKLGTAHMVSLGLAVVWY